MAVIEELIRLEEDGTLSFGNYLMDSKKKVLDFEVNGDLYQVKTFDEITRLEKNGRLLFESVPGATAHHFQMNEREVSFRVEGKEDLQITMELEAEKEYKIIIDDVNVGKVKANLGGKISFSLEMEKEEKEVRIEKVNA